MDRSVDFKSTVVMPASSNCDSVQGCSDWMNVHPSVSMENSSKKAADPNEMSRYDKLLQQVENLKLENSSLKKELCSNTSQINRLESEASSLKEMVVKLGNSINAQSSIEQQDMHLPSDAALKYMLPSSSNLSFPLLPHQPLHLTHPPPAINLYKSVINTTQIGYVPDVRWQISNLQFKKTSILESLKREESTKENYMHQLRDLNDRLKGLTEADKQFLPSGEQTRRLLESSIYDIQQTMEKDLGSPDKMRHRTQDWLQQIRLIENEIQRLYLYYYYMESQRKTTFAIGDTINSLKRTSEHDFGICERHKLFNRGCKCLVDISIQTPEWTCSYDNLSSEKTIDTSPISTEIKNGLNLLSRTCQTLTTCLGSQNSSSSSMNRGFKLDSMESLPGNTHAESNLETSGIQPPPADDDAGSCSSMFSFTTSLPHPVAATSSTPKVNVIELISKLGSHNPEDMIRTFHSLSLSIDSCNAMRQAGCLSLLVQLLHDGSVLTQPFESVQQREKIEKKIETRKLAAQALKNIVCSNINKEELRVESHILSHLEAIRSHCDALQKYTCLNVQAAKVDKSSACGQNNIPSASSVLPSIPDSLLQSIQEVMHRSYDEPIRVTINDLGGLFCVAELLILDCVTWKAEDSDSALASHSEHSLLLRHCAGLTLINLTFGDSVNKTLLIKMQGFLDVVVDQLHSKSEEIQQAMASILRNLSWQADEQGRDYLRQKRVVKTLSECVINVKREATLKSMLSALWNLSGHCPQNRIDICAVEGLLAFLVSCLSKSSLVIESGGGILRNVSSVVATNEEYRQILRNHDCLQILLKQLSSPSLTIVSNACGTLWNLSARDETDQKILWELGAVVKLSKLINSKHRVIAQGSSAALRNLIASQPDKLESIFATSSDAKKGIPSLQTRKLKQFQSEIEQAASQSASDVSESFSPRHHAQATSNQSPIKACVQRHSLQERSIGSPQFHRKGSGIYSSGSLGNLPQQTYDSLTNRPFQAWDGRCGDHGNMPLFESTVNNRGTASKEDEIKVDRSFSALSNVPRSTCLGPRFNNCATNLKNNSYSSEAISGKCSNSAKASNPTETWDSSKSLANSVQRPKQNPNQGKIGATASRMPTDLVEKLRHANDDFCLLEDDDKPVDYSKKFTDELSRTPAVQSPRDLDMYENSSHPSASSISMFTKTFQKKIPVNGISDGKMEKIPTFSSSNNNNSCVIKRHATTGVMAHPKIDASVEQKVLYVDDEAYEPEETPKNFSALYSEEQVFENCPEKYTLQAYSAANEEPSLTIPGTNVHGDVSERVKKYNVEDTPICFSAHSSLSDLHIESNNHHVNSQSNVIGRNTDGQSLHSLRNSTNIGKQHLSECIDSEENDKFDSQPGTMTPYLYNKSARHSGMMTPRTPMFQETPIIFSPSSSRSSLTCDEGSIHSNVSSEPGSRMLSGAMSPSDLPDSPGQSMPASRCRSPTYLQNNGLKSVMPFKTTDKLVPKTESSNNLNVEQPKTSSAHSSVSNITGSEFISKAYAMSSGYLKTLSQEDETRCFTVEPAMSVMTGFSGLTIDDEKVKPVKSIQSDNTSMNKLEKAGDSDSTSVKLDIKDAGSRTIMQAGYVQSLPTNDEIKHFVCEGSMSPLTGLSEISALRSHNNGFQKDSGSSPRRIKKSGTSNGNSFTSRSSATGASVPLPPISQKPEASDTKCNGEVIEKTKPVPPENDSGANEKTDLKDFDDNNLSDFTDDDDSIDGKELLDKCIEMAMPKKRPTSRTTGSKSKKGNNKLQEKFTNSGQKKYQNELSRNSGGQLEDLDKVPCKLGVNNLLKEDKVTDAPVSAVQSNVNDATKQPGYITSMPSSDEIKQFVVEGSLSPMTCLSEISTLHSHNNGFQKSTSSNVDIPSDRSDEKAVISKVTSADVKSSICEGAVNSVPEKCQDVANMSAPNDDGNIEKFDATHSALKEDNKDECSDDDLFFSSSDDDGLLEEVIESAIPKKKSRSKPVKCSNSSSRKDKSSSSSHKHLNSRTTSKAASKKSTTSGQDAETKTNFSHSSHKPVSKYDTRDRIAAANSRLNGMDIMDYIKGKMASVPGDSSDSLENEKTPRPTYVKRDIDTAEVARRTQTSRQVIKDVETLDESYSVKKQLRLSDKSKQEESPSIKIENDSSSLDQVNKNLPIMCDQAKVQAFLQSKPITFKTEGTPVEISRCTSLSNLTFESASENYDFSALQQKVTEDQKDPPTSKLIEAVSGNGTYSAAEVEGSATPIQGNEIENQHDQTVDKIDARIANDYSGRNSLFNNKNNTSYAALVSAENAKRKAENSTKTQENYFASDHGSLSHKSSRGDMVTSALSSALQQQPMLPSLDELSKKQSFQEVCSVEICSDQNIPDVQSQHYGEETHNLVKDKPMSYRIEDTPYCISGNESSLSSIDIESEEEGCNLLKDCISSAMPVARKDHTAAIPPNQLLLMQQSNQLSYSEFDQPATTQLQAASTRPLSDAEWAIVHREANATAAMLSEKQQLDAISPLSLASLSSPDQPGTSFGHSTRPGNHLDDDELYHLSRQPSISDSINSDASLMLGGDAKSLMKSQNSAKPRIYDGKKTSDFCSSDEKPPRIKGGKKMYRSPVTGLPRENLNYPHCSKDNNSSKSSNSKRNKRNRVSESSNSPCNKCHPNYSRQLPISSSMGRLEDVAPGRPYQKNTSSIYSKPIVCGHMYEPRKPIRSRSAHAGYQSSVTQLYPRIEEINSIMLNGVASMAARGDMIVAQCEGQTTQFVPVAIPTSYTADGHQIIQRPVLVKQGTFIQDQPSHALLQSGAHQIPTLYKVVSNPQSSKSNKTQASNEGGKSKVTLKKRIKKLLSPNEENKSTSPGSLPKKKHSNATKYQHASTNNKNVSNSKSSDQTTGGINSNTWSKSKRKQDANTHSQRSSKNVARVRQCSPPASRSHSSSLSLSSSSASNESSGSFDAFKQEQPKKSMYPTVASINSSHHFPKSPAAKTRMSVRNLSSNYKKNSCDAQASSSGLSSFNGKLAHFRKSSFESSSSVSSSNLVSRKTSGISQKKRPGSRTSSSTNSGKNPNRSMRAPAKQHESVLSTHEAYGVTARTYAVEDVKVYTPQTKRVVQEVAPFNYVPNRTNLPTESSVNDAKAALLRKQTTV